MNKIKHTFILIIAVLGLTVAPLATTSNAVVGIKDAKEETAKGACAQKGGTTNSRGEDCSEGGSDLSGIFRTVANILLFLVGAIAVIMLIIGGFRYVASNGDANAVKGAKDTILYALIGIVVAFLAFAAVNFVIDQLTKATEKQVTSSQKANVLI